MESDKKVQGFVVLIDSALAIARDRLSLRSRGVVDMAPPGALEYMVDALSAYRDKALSGEPSLPKV